MRQPSAGAATVSPPPPLRRHQLRNAGVLLFLLPALLLLGLWLIPLGALLLRASVRER